MSAKEDYNDLGPGEIDTTIIRRYVGGGNVPTAGLVLSLCAHIDALERSDLVAADLELELRAAVADLHAAEERIVLFTAERDQARAYMDRLDMHDMHRIAVELDDDATLALERDLRAKLEACE